MEKTPVVQRRSVRSGSASSGSSGPRLAAIAAVLVLSSALALAAKPQGAYVADRSTNGVAIRLTLEVDLSMGDADVVTGSMDFYDRTEPVTLAGIFTARTGIANIQGSQQRAEGDAETHQLTARYDAARDLFEVTLEPDQMSWLATPRREPTETTIEIPDVIAERVPASSEVPTDASGAVRDEVERRAGPAAGILGSLFPKSEKQPRRLVMESAAVDPAEGEVGQTFTLRFAYLVSNLQRSGVLVVEDARLEMIGGAAPPVKIVTRDVRPGEGRVEMLPGGEGRVKVTYEVTPSRAATYVWRIELAAEGYPSPPVTAVTFVVHDAAGSPLPAAEPEIPASPTAVTPEMMPAAGTAILPEQPAEPLAVPPVQPATSRALDYLAKGMLLMGAGSAAEAEREFDSAVRLNPAHGEAWFDLGLSRLQQERWEPASMAFRQAVRLLPADADAHAYYAWALLKLGRRDEAMVQATEAKELGGSGHPVMKDLGLEP